jgi:hypothetical protein
MRKWILVVAVCVCVPIVAWYGWSFHVSKGARKIDRAMVFVTFHAQSTRCDVRTGVSGARNTLPCEDAASYIRDVLKEPVGATFAAIDLGNSGAAIASLNSALEAAGYRSVGTIRAFVSEPEPIAGNR